VAIAAPIPVPRAANPSTIQIVFMLLLFLPLPLLIKIYKFCDITSAYLIREPSCAQVPTVNGGIYYVEIKPQVFVKSAALQHF